MSAAEMRPVLAGRGPGALAGVTVTLPPEALEALAVRAAALVVEMLSEQGGGGGDEWLNVDRAAAYLSCQPKRIYDLRSQGRIRFAKDGSRLLFRRSWLDAYLGEEG